MTTPVVSVPVSEMELDDAWADKAVGAQAPTLQASATSPPAPVASAATPTVEPDVTAEVIALGAKDSVLKLGIRATVVNHPFDTMFYSVNGLTVVLSGSPTPTSGGKWTGTICDGHRAGEELALPPECIRPIQEVSAPPKRTTDYDVF